LRNFIERNDLTKEADSGPCALCVYFEDGFCNYFKKEKNEENIYSACFRTSDVKLFPALLYATSKLIKENKEKDKYFEIYRKEGLYSALEKAILDLQSMTVLFNETELFLGNYIQERLRR
jgi:hypothetical protein